MLLCTSIHASASGLSPIVFDGKSLPQRLKARSYLAALSARVELVPFQSFVLPDLGGCGSQCGTPEAILIRTHPVSTLPHVSMDLSVMTESSSHMGDDAMFLQEHVAHRVNTYE